MARPLHHPSLSFTPLRPLSGLPAHRSARRAPRLIRWTLALTLIAGHAASARQPTPSDGIQPTSPTSPTSPAPAPTLPAAPPAPKPPAAPPSTKPAEKDNSADAIRDFTVRQIARMCIADLRLIDEPTAEDYRIAGLGLSLAADLAPTDADLLRKRIESAWNADQPDQARELTKQLIVLDPSDTVALLRFITAMIAQKQTATGRLELYERFTGPKASALDPAMRSRLALDAALLYRETGDEQSFRRLLKLATTSDSTNKEAAMLALTTFQQDRPTDVVGQFELLSNLLMADPLDAMVQLTMASELASHGSYAQAKRFHRKAVTLITSAGAPAPEGSDVEALILDWQVKGPNSILDILNGNLEAQREKMRKYKASNAGIGEGLDVGSPDDLRLGPENEKVRLAASIATENAPSVTGSLLDMNRSVEFMFKVANDDKKRPVALTREDALRLASGAMLDLQFWRVLAGLELDKVEPDLAKFEGDVGKTQAGPDLVRACLKVRQGETDAGLALLDSIAAQSPKGGMIWSTAQFGRGLAFEAQGRRDDAIAAYRDAQRSVPMAPIGALSRARADKIVGKVESPSPLREELTRLAESVPEWTDKMISDPKSFITLLADMPSKISVLEEAPLRVTIRNVAAIPLALGSDRSINTRIMLAPVLTLRSGTLQSLAAPEVIQLDRRLRLEKQESLQISIHADWGFTGFLTELLCDQQSQIKWRLLQGFTSKDSGGFGPGPHSLATDSSSTIRTAIDEARLPPGELTKIIASAQGSTLIRAFAAARRSIWTEEIVKLSTKPPAAAAEAAPSAADSSAPPKPVDPKTVPKADSKPADTKPTDTRPAPSSTAAKPAAPSSPTTTPTPSSTPPATPSTPPTTPPEPALDQALVWAADRASIVAALVARYPDLSREARIMLVATMPHAGQFKELEPLDALALADSDPTVQTLALLSRVKAVDDPALAAAAASSNPRLAELAALLSARLARPGHSYSRLGPSLQSMRGDAEPLKASPAK